MTFLFRDTVSADAGTVSVAFTERRLDLGDRAPAEVREAGLAEVAAATGAAPYLMRQVHGSTVYVVDAMADPPEADALVTATRGIALVARAADCVPVLLADPSAPVIGAVHAGRNGVAAGVVPRALAAMTELGAGSMTGSVRAWVGPHVCGACYEVPAAMRADVATVVPETWSVTSWGTPALDLGAGVTAQLEAAGCAVVQLGRCTREETALPSHRRDGEAAGRFAGVVWISDG